MSELACSIHDKRRALVVDADEGCLAFAAEVLASFRPGLEVATARDLREAREWLDTFRPDLLLIDSARMAEGDGESRPGLLDDPRLRECRVLVLSREAEPHVGPALGCAGPQAILSKPLDLRSLLRAVRDLVENCRSNALGQESAAR